MDTLAIAKILEENYEKEAYKYTKIIEKDSIQSIYQYIYSTIEENEYMPTAVMDKIFGELYQKGTQAEKFNLFYLYYFNTITTETIFQDYLQTNSNLNYFNNYWNAIDFNNLESLSSCRQKDVQQLATILLTNHYTIQENYPEMLVYFDWGYFLDKFESILDKEIIDFVKLLDTSTDLIINPHMEDYNALVSIWFLHEFETYIKGTNNVYMKGAAQSIYEQHLAFFTGQFSSDLIIETTEEGSYLSPSVIIAYKQYIDLYPDDYTTALLKEILEVCNYAGEMSTDDLVTNFGELMTSFINDSGWLVNEATNWNNEEIITEGPAK